MTSETTDARGGAAENAVPTQPRLQLEFHSDDLAEPFRDQFEERLRIDVDSVVYLPDDGHLQYWTVRHTSARSLVETVMNFPTTLDARLVSTEGETHRIEVRGSPDSLFSAFDTFDGVTETAVYDEDGVRVVAEFPPDVDADVVVDAVHDIYPDLELVSSRTVETIEVFRHRVATRLTDRQLSVLRVAYFGGYFERPRLSTGAELADTMGVSKQSFHEHLRKAYRGVFELLLDRESSAPG